MAFRPDSRALTWLFAALQSTLQSPVCRRAAAPLGAATCTPGQCMDFGIAGRLAGVNGHRRAELINPATVSLWPQPGLGTPFYLLWLISADRCVADWLRRRLGTAALCVEAPVRLINGQLELAATGRRHADPADYCRGCTAPARRATPALAVSARRTPGSQPIAAALGDRSETQKLYGRKCSGAIDSPRAPSAQTSGKPQRSIASHG